VVRDPHVVTPRSPRGIALARAAAPWSIAVLGVLLAWYSQISLRVGGLGRVPLALVVVAIGAIALANVAHSRWWRIRPVQAWLAWWLAMAVAAALTWRSLPVGEDRVLAEVRAVVTAREEMALLAAGAVAGTVLIGTARGSRRGVAGFRWLWLGVLLSTAPVALWEIATDQHIVVTRWLDWYFTPHTPAATFANPNNYGCVLVAVVGTLLAWSLDAVSRWLAALLLALAACAAWLTWATLSRGAFAAIAVQVLIAVIGLAARRGWLARMRATPQNRRRSAAGGVVLVLLAAATFVVPALAARNPLLRAPKAGEGASDDARIELVRAAVRYWQSSPLVGTGPGTYEYHLTMERPAGVPDPTTNAHNAFAEILSQYGLLGSVPLVVLLGLLLWYVVRPAPDIARRVELACVLVAFVVTGLVVSSALALPLWFVMLAHAVAVGWSLQRDTDNPDPA